MKLNIFDRRAVMPHDVVCLAISSVMFLLLQVHDNLRQQHQFLQRGFLVAVQRPIFLLHTKTQRASQCGEGDAERGFC